MTCYRASQPWKFQIKGRDGNRLISLNYVRHEACVSPFFGINRIELGSKAPKAKCVTFCAILTHRNNISDWISHTSILFALRIVPPPHRRELHILSVKCLHDQERIDSDIDPHY